MKNFYMTFGVQYPSEPHPYWSGADGAGWVRIVAESENMARQIAEQFFGMAWSRLYTEPFFDASDSRRFYRRGEILVLQQKDRIRLQDAIDNRSGFIVDPSPDLGTFTDPSEEKVTPSE